ncbi:hypothetical protein, partial [Eggerthella lenta]|uniref:hypothetical protein n=1 Tax=Eggerthella lenta TaxID=84112 RepID=UPI001E513F5B
MAAISRLQRHRKPSNTGKSEKHLVARFPPGAFVPLAAKNPFLQQIEPTIRAVPEKQGRVPNRGVSGPSPENRRHPCEVNLSL